MSLPLVHVMLSELLEDSCTVINPRSKRLKPRGVQQASGSPMVWHGMGKVLLGAERGMAVDG